jgi:hypothetical protein
MPIAALLLPLWTAAHRFSCQPLPLWLRCAAAAAAASRGCVIGHGIVLLLSIAKWHDLLISQLPVNDGNRQAPPDLSNLLPKGTDLDPDTWLMRHELMLAFLRRIANASNTQPDMFP